MPRGKSPPGVRAMIAAATAVSKLLGERGAGWIVRGEESLSDRPLSMYVHRYLILFSSPAWDVATVWPRQTGEFQFHTVPLPVKSKNRTARTINDWLFKWRFLPAQASSLL